MQNPSFIKQIIFIITLSLLTQPFAQAGFFDFIRIGAPINPKDLETKIAAVQNKTVSAQVCKNPDHLADLLQKEDDVRRSNQPGSAEAYTAVGVGAAVLLATVAWPLALIAGGVGLWEAHKGRLDGLSGNAAFDRVKAKTVAGLLCDDKNGRDQLSKLIRDKNDYDLKHLIEYAAIDHEIYSGENPSEAPIAMDTSVGPSKAVVSSPFSYYRGYFDSFGSYHVY